MAYVVLSHVSTGELATAALHNTLLDNIAIIKTSISNDGDDWTGDVVAASGKKIGWSDGYWTRVGANSTRFWDGATNGAVEMGPLTASTGSFAGTTSGCLAIGGIAYNHVMVCVGLSGGSSANPLTNSHQVAVYTAISANSHATGAGSFLGGFETALTIDAGSIVLERAASFNIGYITVGAGSSVTRTYGFAATEETVGTTGNASFCIFDAAVTGNWFIYYDGSRKSSLAGGDLLIPTELYRSNATSYTRIAGGSAVATGATVTLFGQTHATVPNLMTVAASGVTITPITGTAACAIGMTNTSGAANVGLDNSAGTAFFSTNTAYSTTLHSSVAAGVTIAATHGSGALRFFTGGTSVKWTMDATGNLIGANHLNFEIHGNGQIYVQTAASATGTNVVHNANGFYYDFSSSRRFKTNFAPFDLTDDLEREFLALKPEFWDYTSGLEDGALSFMAEDLHSLSLRNIYGRSPLVNYDADGLPKSNRDYGLIAVLHQIVARQQRQIDTLTTAA